MLYPSPKTQTRRERTAQRRIPIHLSKRLCNEAALEFFDTCCRATLASPPAKLEDATPQPPRLLRNQILQNPMLAGREKGQLLPPSNIT